MSEIKNYYYYYYLCVSFTVKIALESSMNKFKALSPIGGPFNRPKNMDN